ncbi:hypothetical protein BAUCODRAFT_489472 [Baudoinia panamericana UAMH 10762]|uniref:Uncharacterized protein n=1 Tax=Baudoinia panamericana (strain UAMH 10762) TaxID=717646 RepID=M2MJA8_BAUPA|nr:uncharacterized protein BAUCODRAFT_489472 [Baudoinia panamericana UAMH 10762]EMC96766.1 hypothetical protein BAUCODRAFT_489472 [Baudoinia panamericana UAMH 10762]
MHVPAECLIILAYKSAVRFRCEAAVPAIESEGADDNSEDGVLILGLPDNVPLESFACSGAPLVSLAAGVPVSRCTNDRRPSFRSNRMSMKVLGRHHLHDQETGSIASIASAGKSLPSLARHRRAVSGRQVFSCRRTLRLPL